ncbi:PAS domain S-box protein [Dankookia rubra]|uniref:histidine kinase n=1 Tax=Dankookia rubra TaxID=1442381 RepID=A0A4R5QCA8_9PROT|nr:HWE histidine kinase domain-containing protein [Dankookia rubra]TDH60760.1 PAS domain S-box protein [Dankookia rubra]
MANSTGDNGTPDYVVDAGMTSGPEHAGRELELFKTAVEAVGEAILITGPELEPPGPRIEYVNPGFTHMTGYTLEEMLGRTPRVLQGPGTDRAVLARMRAALKAGHSFRAEAVNYRKDGTEYIVEWLITPVLDRDGHIVHWVSAQRDVTERRMAEAIQRRLHNEVNHRVNNTLAAVQSMALQTLQAAPCSEEVRTAFLSRLFALSRVHSLLARGHWTGVPLRDLALAQLGHHSGGNLGGIEISGPEMSLRPGAAIALGMVLHELAANAAVHGALSVPSGRVQLRWSIRSEAAGRLRMHWVEEGGPPVPSPPKHRGFGARLIERGLVQEVQAETRLLFKSAGVQCEIDAPLEVVAVAA